jgi:hypothetical protein
MPEHQPEIGHAVRKIDGLFNEKLLFIQGLINLALDYMMQKIKKNQADDDKYHNRYENIG